jgi:hypothetical protein
MPGFVTNRKTSAEEGVKLQPPNPGPVLRHLNVPGGRELVRAIAVRKKRLVRLSSTTDRQVVKSVE